MDEYYLERLEDVFARKHICSPRRVRRFLQTRDFRVNGKRVFERGTKLSLFHDEYTLDGLRYSIDKDIYLVMNKKAGTLCTHQKGEWQRVYDLIPEELMGSEKTGVLHTLGRLDGNTEGLLILTTNGDFSHAMADPEKHVDKKYFVILEKAVSPEQQENYRRCFEEGVELPPMWNAGGFVTKPAVLEWVNERECYLQISEGKFHQVKRMFLFMENQVEYLRRISIGGFVLPEDLELGQFRHMTEAELLSVVQR